MNGLDKSIERCCGTCRFYIARKPLNITDLKDRVRTEYCRLNQKDTYPGNGRGCLGWKQADGEEMRKRKASGI